MADDTSPWPTGRARFCSECGTPLSVHGAFCPQCGASIAHPGQGAEAAPHDPNVTTVLSGTDATHGSGGDHGGAYGDPSVPRYADAASTSYADPQREDEHGRSSRRVLVAAAAVAVLLGAAVTTVALTRPGGSGGRTASTAATTNAPTRAASTTSPATDLATPTPSSSTSSTTPPAASFASLYQDVNSGVVRIETSTCDGGAIGTGFLLSPTLVATVAHVVDGAASLRLTLGDGGSGGTTSGTVVGIDQANDLALVRTNRPVPGHVFRLASTTPTVGQEVAAIGFPEGQPMTLTRGIVSGLERTIPIEGRDRTGLIQTDAALNPGNSGGPLLSTDGEVYGLVDAQMTGAAGIGYAVSPTTAAARLDAWRTSTVSVVSASCATPSAPDGGQSGVTAQPPADDPVTVGVTGALNSYYVAINTGDWDTVWHTLSPRRRGSSPDALAKGLATTYDGLVQVHSVTSRSDGSALAHVTFTSVQSPEQGPDGDTCDEWDLDYAMVPSGSTWLIDTVTGHVPGRTHTTC